MHARFSRSLPPLSAACAQKSPAAGKPPHSFRARIRLPSSHCSQGFPPPSSSVDGTRKALLLSVSSAHECSARAHTFYLLECSKNFFECVNAKTLYQVHYESIVPMFENMDDQLMDAMCDRQKPALYTKESCIIREGDPVDEMLFIMRGKLLSVTTNGGRTGFFNSEYLKGGDFCGEELLTWALDPHSTPSLPISTRTVKALSEVEAFVLAADDLKFVTTQFRRLHSKQLRHTFRFYSQQWRTWAACFIQAAWRHYSRKKMEEALHEEEDSLHPAMVKSNGHTPSLGATIFASRFAVNALRVLRRNGARKARMQERLPVILLQKPSEPDFTSEEY